MLQHLNPEQRQDLLVGHAVQMWAVEQAAPQEQEGQYQGQGQGGVSFIRNSTQFSVLFQEIHHNLGLKGVSGSKMLLIIVHKNNPYLVKLKFRKVPVLHLHSNPRVSSVELLNCTKKTLNCAKLR